MPVQSSNRNTTWVIDADDQTWTLAKNAKISVENEDGIYENSHNNSDIRVLGDINISGEVAAVRFSGTDSSVLIGKDAHINGKNAEVGIFTEGAGAEIVNRGQMNVGDTAIFGNVWANVSNYGDIASEDKGIMFTGNGAQVYNYGTIASDTGVQVQTGGTYVENAKGAEIDAKLEGILVLGDGDSEIVNKGIVRGGEYSIVDGEGNATVTNTGKLFGYVSLGAGDDTIDTRKGVIKGILDGGYGDDTYFISSSKQKIYEDRPDGDDEVRSTASYKLSDGIELLTLLGKADINGTGSDDANNVTGNKGDNHLSGKAGMDFIAGGRGNDLLTGGADADRFLFTQTAGSDVIDDFQDGSDRLYIDGIFNQETFDALDIRQSKGDVIIEFDGGNKIRIEDLTKANFTFDDIILLA